MLTNARSLSPKIESLHEYFSEHDIDVALITESWLKDGSILDRDVIDLEFGTNLKILYKNRPRNSTGARRVGGGVSIVFNKATSNLRERKIVGNNFELLMAVGRVGKADRQFAFICAYIEPRTRVAQLKELNDLINSQILQLKSKGDPAIFVGGDLNHRSLADALDDFPDVKRINFDPTRGPACLDVLHSNLSPTPTSWPPLTSRQGNDSDHSCVVFEGSVPIQRGFHWLRKKSRKHTSGAVAAFGREMAAADWGRILGGSNNPDVLVREFERHVEEATDRLFPIQYTRCRSNESPWITNAIRRLSKQKKGIYRREHKSAAWIGARNRLDAMIEQSKQQYVNRVEKNGSSRSYFTAVKALSSSAAPKDWNVTDLFPGKSQLEAGNAAAEYFSRISNMFEPLENPGLPPSPSGAQ